MWNEVWSCNTEAVTKAEKQNQQWGCFCIFSKEQRNIENIGKYQHKFFIYL